MLQHEFLDNLERSARGTKEHVTSKGPRDLNPYIVAHRGDAPVALVTLNQMDSQLIIRMGSVCAAGFDADNIGNVYETYETTPEHSATNPVTGKPWQNGEINQAVEHHDAIANGWIHEAVSLTVVNRAGDVGMKQLPFRYSGKHLLWLEAKAWTSSLDSPNAIGGPFTEALVAFMSVPSGSQMVGSDFPLDRNERDLATAAYLTTSGHAVLMYADASDRERQRLFGPDWKPN